MCLAKARSRDIDPKLVTPPALQKLIPGNRPFLAALILDRAPSKIQPRFPSKTGTFELASPIPSERPWNKPIFLDEEEPIFPAQWKTQTVFQNS